MKFHDILAIAVLSMILAVAAAGAADHHRENARLTRDTAVESGQPVAAVATRDTLYLLGGPDRWDGRFEDPDGQPNWHGWTGDDRSVDPTTYWHVSDFHAVNGQYSMWCGTYFDDDPGYGNSWDQRLVFSYEVPDPSASYAVNLALTVQNDTEPDYDYTYVEFNRGGVWFVWGSGTYDGIRTFEFNETTNFDPGDYVGEAGDEIRLRVRFNSDGAWSDEDGLWLTDGACQIDDITVTVDGSVVDFEDFEDGASDHWIPVPAPVVGDFSHLVHAPGHLDPCQDNDTWMVCFVDDGIVVPGTGGTTYDEWDYGPGGYVLNWEGGLAGPDHYLDNHVVSPPLAIPAGYEGAALAFDVYRHQILNLNYVPMLIEWSVRSTTSEEVADLENAPWRNHNYVYYGGPEFTRMEFPLHEQIDPGARWLQVSVGVIEIFCWGWCYGTTPAPYYDNVAVKVFDFEGPAVMVDHSDLPRDAFPQQGFLDLADLASNSCRFDPALAAGDSIAVMARTLAANATLVAPPDLHVWLRANPLFDSVRLLPAGFEREGDRIRGTVAADSCRDLLGRAIDHRWFFDLPDAGFLFPGDELHYLVAAIDELVGDQRTTLWPADTTGFAAFDSPRLASAYDPAGVVRFLPSVTDAEGVQPPTLLWNDAGPEHTTWWALRLAEAAGLVHGLDYDVFTTRAPSQGIGDGLGAAATPALLGGYDRILYTAGDHEQHTLDNGDLGLLAAWLDVGGDLLLCGDGWAGDLAGDPLGAEFLEYRAGVQVASGNQQELLDGQASPRVAALADGGVFPAERAWRLHGTCPQVRRFNLLEPTPSGGALLVAEYLNPDDQPGIYPYAAAALRTDLDTGSRIISLSWDLAAAVAGGDGSGAPTAAVLLRDILAFFGQSGTPVGARDLPGAMLVSAYPNPFNPRTTIRLDLPRDTEVRFRIYDLRGAVVRTLHRGPMSAGRHELVWIGTDDRRRAVASGVYFFEVRTPTDRRLGKLTLVR